MRRAGAALIARMEEASIDLAETESEEDSHNTPDPLTSNKEGKDYKADNSDAKSHDDKLNIQTTIQTYWKYHWENSRQHTVRNTKTQKDSYKHYGTKQVR
jgi:hypothetical protein